MLFIFINYFFNLKVTKSDLNKELFTGCYNYKTDIDPR